MLYLFSFFVTFTFFVFNLVLLLIINDMNIDIKKDEKKGKAINYEGLIISWSLETR